MLAPSSSLFVPLRADPKLLLKGKLSALLSSLSVISRDLLSRPQLRDILFVDNTEFDLLLC